MFGQYAPLLDKMVQMAMHGYSRAEKTKPRRKKPTLDGSGDSGRDLIFIIGGPGHGDHARALAFADGVRMRHGSEAHVVFIGRFTGSMVEWDMLESAKAIGVINDFILCGARVEKKDDGTYQARAADIPRQAIIATLRSAGATVAYDCVPLAVRAYWSLGCPAGQAVSDAALAPLAFLYDGHPDFDWRLRNLGLSMWDIISTSSGIETKPLSLACAVPFECAPLPDIARLGALPDPENALALLKQEEGVTNWERAKLTGVGDYVVLHNGTGAGGQTKQMPPETWNAIVSFLESDGVRCVQIGDKYCDEIKGTIDRRGLRLPWTCKLIRESLGLVSTESLPVYMAAGMDLSSLVLFGSTPASVYTMDGMNIDMVGRADERGEQRVPCPMGTCFKLQGYGRGCMLPKGNDTGYCLNVPPAADVARVASALVKAVREERKGTFTAKEEGKA